MASQVQLAQRTNLSKRPKRKLIESRSRDFVSALSNGLSVLAALSDSPHGISLEKLGKRTGLKKTTTWRLAQTLVDLGYVRQDTETRCFAPAPRVLTLGYAYFDSLDLRQLAEPFLQELSARVGESVDMAVLDGDRAIFVERIRTPQVVSVSIHVGSTIPLYNTALGKALICDMPESWLQEYIKRHRNHPTGQAYFKNGGRKLRRLLSKTRELGYSINDRELFKDLLSIASPLRGRTNKVVAAINIVVPTSRMSMCQLQRSFVPHLLQAAEKISLALGYRSFH
ncbi:MAG: IclR family transcriptional regulator [Candidatus Acidiferrales bacterium]